jgi:hypothetical protein
LHAQFKKKRRKSARYLLNFFEIGTKRKKFGRQEKKTAFARRKRGKNWDGRAPLLVNVPGG